MFYTRSSLANDSRIPGHRINSDVLRKVAFDASKKTVVLVHGWIENFKIGKWQPSLKDALLRLGNFNVIIVDWTGGNTPPYIQAAVNSRVVGAEIGLLIRKLGRVRGTVPSSFHLYGHSLGAHAVGFAGKWLNGTLGRITALDPAEPMFQYCPPSARLTNSDAKLVEVIHTDADPFDPPTGLGMSIPVGDIDYYPNGGSNMPGCESGPRQPGLSSNESLENARDRAICNHMRAVDYVVDFTESSAMNSTCRPIAFPCESYSLFESGQCTDCGPDGSLCSIMGLGDEGDFYIPSNKTEGALKLFLKTSSQAPFCLHPYEVEVSIGSSPTAILPQIPFVFVKPKSEVPLPPNRLKIIVKLRNGELRDFELMLAADDLSAGAVYRNILYSEKAVQDIQSIGLTHEIERPSMLPLKYLKMKTMTGSTSSRNFTAEEQFFCPPPGGAGIPKKLLVVLKEEFCRRTDEQKSVHHITIIRPHITVLHVPRFL
ncbi:pancreatic triacylglycerol lipase [Galendromus occidentalis]|uniref:Pancreatic triacylglycerol lipase n=1 Tax=Galendromus occidentalis TaxID=34638 RepID=A0AAJ6VY64_9ACAR|nr:pancreatic triacylglycerol lipase [Galendromus occidentalis]